MNSFRKPLLLFLMAACGLYVLSVAHSFFYSQQLDNLRRSEKTTLELVTNSLRSEIRQYEIIGSVLATNKELIEFLGDESETSQEVINQQLQAINSTTGSLDTYLMNREGLSVAASNWKKPNSFVGKNFSYRPYFQQAIGGRAGKFFALGTSTNLRGFYIATPVKSENETLGALVIKVQVEHLESLWRSDGREMSVVANDSVIFLSTRDDWRLRSMRELTNKELNSIEHTRQYPSIGVIKPLEIKTLRRFENGDELLSIKDEGRGRDTRYLSLSSKMEEANWTVLLTRNSRSIETAAFWETLALGFGMVGLNIVILSSYRRYKAAQQRLELELKHNNQLESAIAERTRDLQLSNAELRDTQQRLVQSGRLAAIGRFSAGLSHEMSQPLTAIHSYVSNAQQLITLERWPEAQEKLEHIANLADRIALIIRQLKIFVRGDSISTMPVLVINTISEAQSIMAQRAEVVGATIVVDCPDQKVSIAADETLVQQLFVNLISNALDAASKVEQPRINISIGSRNEDAVIKVSDNGLGVSSKDLANIFEPFYSTKEMNRGLGLGLTISQEIVNRFGGEMTVENNAFAGATFTVLLPLIRSGQ